MRRRLIGLVMAVALCAVTGLGVGGCTERGKPAPRQQQAERQPARSEPPRRARKHGAHEHGHGAHPHARDAHHHHPHPHPHLDGSDGHHHPY